MQLVEQLAAAKEGDYVVTQQDRTYAVILVRHRRDDQVVLEEIAVPSCEKRSESWAQWVRSGAPGHTSWMSYEIDLRTGHVSKSYSYSRRGFVDANQTDSFLSTLLTLDFQPVPLEQRRRVGPPAPGGLEKRALWHPPLVFQGRREKGVAFSAFESDWPKDGTVLAGRHIVIYLPEQGPYPQYLPYWLEIKGPVTPMRLRVVDSGSGLRSPQPAIFLGAAVY
jgi:hypothetical protein